MSSSSGMDLMVQSERGYVQQVSVKPCPTQHRISEHQQSINDTFTVSCGPYSCELDVYYPLRTPVYGQPIGLSGRELLLVLTCSATESSSVEPVVSTSPETRRAAQA